MKIALIAVALLAGAAFVDGYGTSAVAQTGSFARTCQRCVVSRGYIECLCQRIRGNWIRASIMFTRCPRYSLTNLDGVLVCGG